MPRSPLRPERRRAPASSTSPARAQAPRERPGSFRACLSSLVAHASEGETRNRPAAPPEGAPSGPRSAAPPPFDCGASSSAWASAAFASSNATRAPSSFVSTPERAAMRSSSAPTVRTDRSSFCGSASPSRPRRRRMSATPRACRRARPGERECPSRCRNGCAIRARRRRASQWRGRPDRPRSALSLVLERADRGLSVLLLRREPDRLGLQPREFFAPSRRRRRQAGERREPTLRVAQRRQMRQRRRAAAG